MRELTYFVAISLDGRIAGPDGSFDAFPMVGDHMDMIARDYRDTLPTVALDAMGLVADGSRFDTVLMGWNTYAVGLPFGMTDPYPHLRQYVFTRGRAVGPEAGGAGTAAGPGAGASAGVGVTVTSDDPVAVVRSLKAEEFGNGVWLCGGGHSRLRGCRRLQPLLVRARRVNDLRVGCRSE